jgi:hypothetical protein
MQIHIYCRNPNMTLSKLLPLSVMLTAAAASSSAWAHHFHYGPHVGVYVGPAFGWGWYEPYYYPPPPVVVVPATPPTYVEQAPPQEVQPAAPQNDSPSGYWHYCPKPEGYYPYVKQCPRGWQRVAPRPPQS